jgi:uncharacterized protein (DUF433 family)
MIKFAPAKPVTPERPLSAEDLEGDLIQPGHPLFGIIWVNPDRLHGAPCFAGTRVPIKNLFDYLGGGQPLSEFLVDFEGVTLSQAEAVIEMASLGLLEQLPHA